MRLPALLLVLAAAAVLAGCLRCEPHLDVRHCLPEGTRCPIEGRAVPEWDATWAAAWPDVDELIRGTPEGEHGHRDWDPAREASWWRAVGIDPSQPEKEAYFRHDGALFRVRVLSCG